MMPLSSTGLMATDELIYSLIVVSIVSTMHQ